MQEIEEGGQRAFSTFRVLNGESNAQEREQLFRNMAQLFSFVSDRCDDEQVAQYDDVLCQLADVVEIEARMHVSRLLAPLDRVPGTVVIKLANDDFEVAQPLLEFSSVLSDDDLIEIITNKGEEHRVAIAGRPMLTRRVGDAIVEHGGSPSVGRLVRNPNAEFGDHSLDRLFAWAAQDTSIATDLRGRSDIDWSRLSNEINAAAAKFLKSFVPEAMRDDATSARLKALVYNRMRNRAGFNSQEWKVAFNQVKALHDRGQLDDRALARFARFGYGHHAAAALTQQLCIHPEVFVKWLASQDYVAMIVALRAAGLQPDLFVSVMAVMPWRDMPTEADKANVRTRFEAITMDDAIGIFELWRAHAFRKRHGMTDTVGTA